MAGSGLGTAKAKETPSGKSDDKDVKTKTTENANTMTTDGSLDKVSEQTMAQFSGTSKEVRHKFCDDRLSTRGCDQTFQCHC